MVIIKKYGNRRLYDTERSAYVNLDDIAGLIRSGRTVKVVDSKSGEDLTREVLLQVLLEALQGSTLFPPGVLHRIIRATGDDPVSTALRQQLGLALGLMDEQLSRVEQLFGMVQRETPPPEPTAPPEPPPPEPAFQNERTDARREDPEMDELRARLEALESRLKRR